MGCTFCSNKHFLESIIVCKTCYDEILSLIKSDFILISRKEPSMSFKTGLNRMDSGKVFAEIYIKLLEKEIEKIKNDPKNTFLFKSYELMANDILEKQKETNKLTELALRDIILSREMKRRKTIQMRYNNGEKKNYE